MRYPHAHTKTIIQRGYFGTRSHHNKSFILSISFFLFFLIALIPAVSAAAGITVGLINGPTTEGGGTATFTVVLTSEPTADVTIGVSSSDTSEGTVAPSSLTFTAGDWSTAQTVTVTGVDDSVVDGDIGYTILLAAASSADGTYNGLDDERAHG
jgi:hypothetical protein